MSVPSPASGSNYPEQGEVHIGLSDETQRDLFADFQKEIPLKNGKALAFTSTDLGQVLDKKKLTLTLDGKPLTLHIGEDTPLFKRLQELNKDPQDTPVAKALLYKNIVAMLSIMDAAEKVTATFKGNICETVLIGKKALSDTDNFQIATKQTGSFSGAVTGTNYSSGIKTRTVTLQLTYLGSSEKVKKIRDKFTPATSIATPPPSPAAKSSPSSDLAKSRRPSSASAVSSYTDSGSDRSETHATRGSVSDHSIQSQIRSRSGSWGPYTDESDESDSETDSGWSSDETNLPEVGAEDALPEIGDEAALEELEEGLDTSPLTEDTLSLESEMVSDTNSVGFVDEFPEEGAFGSDEIEQTDTPLQDHLFSVIDGTPSENQVSELPIHEVAHRLNRQGLLAFAARAALPFFLGTIATMVNSSGERVEVREIAQVLQNSPQIPQFLQPSQIFSLLQQFSPYFFQAIHP